MFNQKLLVVAISCLLLSPISVSANTQANLIQAGEVALTNGQINNAVNLLIEAQQHSVTPEEKSYASTALAEALIRSNKFKLAELELKKAAETAKTSTAKNLLGDIALRYGHLYTARDNSEKAETKYQEALSIAESTQDHALATAALINLAKITEQENELTLAQQHLDKLSASAYKESMQLALGYQAMQQQLLPVALKNFQTVSKDSQNSRNKAQAIGYIGHLYEAQQRYQEALQATETALVTDSSPDLHLKWTWQRARLLEATGDKANALSDYRSTIKQLESIRLDIPVLYLDGESSFKQTYAPIYLSFIDLLLEHTKQSTDENAQVALREVIQTWEQLKSVEMQDYFKDACAVKQQAQSTPLDPKTAVFYPILLKDHLALVLRTADRISAFRVEHTPAEVETIVNRFKDKLLSDPLPSVETLEEPKTLYQWLITPLKTELAQHQIDTIVYLPDGVLRKIPFSLLREGNQFLIEQYALVTVPALSLLSAKSKSTDRADILLAGMSKPGPVVEELLSSGIDLFGPPEASRGLDRGLSRRSIEVSDESRQITDPAERGMRASQLKEELALPGVTEELKTLSGLTPQPVLENDTFLLDALSHSVNQGHSAVHIASHGFFSGDPKRSFIMAYDHLVTMEQLTELFQTEAFNDHPVELVTLSACQTAEGDDRSPLGLSGVVVQAGVKSAIGTLWPVADEAAKQFFSDFYKQYQQPNITKAKAMQSAQLKLLHNQDLNHPALWGPFILVGEWH